MSTPYWPATGQVFQQLNYISSTQVLSLTPGGNSVILNMSTPVQQTLSTFNTVTADVANIQQGNFSTIQVGGEQLLYQNIPNAAIQTLNSSTINASTINVSSLIGATVGIGNLYNAVGQTAIGNISSLNVSSINGQPYVPGGGGGVSRIIAGTNVTISPSGGTGAVTINATGGGSVNPNQAFSSISLAAGSTVFPPSGTPGTINFTGEISLVNRPDQMNATLFSPANGAVSWAIQTPGADGGIQIGSDGSTAFITTVNRVLPISMVNNAGVNISSLNVSSINGAAPGGSVPSDLVVSTITAGGANVSSISFAGGKGTIEVAGPMTVDGVLTCSNQITANGGIEIASGQQLSFVGGQGNISGVSSINGFVYPPVTSLTNQTAPFITGSDAGGGVWTLNVDSNTGGLPQALTGTLTLNSSHSYLVSYALTSGSNSDTTYNSITRLNAYCAGANDINMKTYNGFSNFWIYNGSIGTVIAIISGAAATRLYATNTSPTQSTILFFDTNTSFKVTDLGVTS